MATKLSSFFSARMVIGLIIIAAGAIFYLDTLDLVDADKIFLLWPAIWIAIGIVKLVSPPPSGSRGFGLISVVGGSLLLAANLSLLTVDFDRIWPVAIILVGGWIAFRGYFGRPAKKEEGTPDPTATTNDFALMAGLNRRITSKEFRGGEATAVMGGVELNMREASVGDGEAVLELFAMWGGIDIIVPGDWTVDNRVLPIMGGVEDSRKSVGSDPTKRLILKGFAIMGGIEISN